MAEINEQKNNLMKHFFEKINNIDKPLAKLKQKIYKWGDRFQKNPHHWQILGRCIFSPQKKQWKIKKK